jgi:hypothetical protein
VDTLGERREADVELVSCDFELGGVDAILGYPWLSLVNPSISFVDGMWRHRIDGTKLEIMSTKKFARLAKTELYIYALIVYPTTEARRLAALVMGSSITLPLKYQDYQDVFSEEAVGLLADHHSMEHKINLEPGGQPPYGPVYALSEKELEVLREYLKTSQHKGWIRRSTSPIGAPIMFVQKKGGGLRLYVDYRGLNRITIKDRTPLPLISETIDRLHRAKRFTKLDLKDAYHRIRIREGDE